MDKHPGGRPTLYKPEYCEQVLAFLNEGRSICSIARQLQVSRQTLYDWMDAHQEFLDSVKKGIEFSQGWWEELGRQNLYAKDFNHVLWMMNMKSRFKSDWRDEKEDKSEVTNLINETRELLHKCKS